MGGFQSATNPQLRWLSSLAFSSWTLAPFLHCNKHQSWGARLLFLSYSETKDCGYRLLGNWSSEHFLSFASFAGHGNLEHKSGKLYFQRPDQLENIQRISVKCLECLLIYSIVFPREGRFVIFVHENGSKKAIFPQRELGSQRPKCRTKPSAGQDSLCLPLNLHQVPYSQGEERTCISPGSCR